MDISADNVSVDQPRSTQHHHIPLSQQFYVLGPDSCQSSRKADKRYTWILGEIARLQRTHSGHTGRSDVRYQ